MVGGIASCDSELGHAVNPLVRSECTHRVSGDTNCRASALYAYSSSYATDTVYSEGRRLHWHRPGNVSIDAALTRHVAGTLRLGGRHLADRHDHANFDDDAYEQVIYPCLAYFRRQIDHSIQRDDSSDQLLTNL